VSSEPCNCDQAKALQSELDASANAISALVEQVQALEDELHDLKTEMTVREAKWEERRAAESELAELRAAAHLVLAWIDRSNSVGREAAQRLERALA